MLLGDLLPSRLIDVATDDGLCDKEPLKLSQQLGRAAGSGSLG